MERSGKEMALKIKMCKLVAQVIKSKNWKQREAAYKLDLCQSAISDIMTTSVRNRKVDWYLSIMFNLGYEIQFEFNKSNTI